MCVCVYMCAHVRVCVSFLTLSVYCVCAQASQHMRLYVYTHTAWLQVVLTPMYALDLPHCTLSPSVSPPPPLQTCRMLELSRVERDENETVPLPSSWEIQDEGKMMTLLVTTILKCYLAVRGRSQGRWYEW